LLEHLWEVELTYRFIFAFKFTAAWYCSHYLPPVSTALAKLVAKFAAGVVDTGGKFAAGVVDTGGKFATGVVHTCGAPWLANISAILEKIWNGPNGILWGWGGGGNDSWKKHCPFKQHNRR
jgi:hypothetical protein